MNFKYILIIYTTKGKLTIKMSKKTDCDSRISILTDKYVLLKDFFPMKQDAFLELDLGCGTGDLAVPLAERFPERTVIAADIMLGRLRKVARKAKRRGIENLAFFRVEARHLITLIMPDASIDRLHIICPDPWPKERHRGHRLASSDFMAQIHAKLKPDGIFHFATDDVPYMEMVTKNVETSGLFKDAPRSALEDISDIKTEFERQWLEQGKDVPHKAWQKI